MLERILGANADARVVAFVRTVAAAAIVAVIAAVQAGLQSGGDLGDFWWSPIALVLIRAAEGWFDHSDPDRAG